MTTTAASVKTLDELLSDGYASYSQLKEADLSCKLIRLGTNDFGFQEKKVIDSKNNTWMWIPEDGIYELWS